MKLITEVNEDIGVIKEEVDGKKHYYIEGIYMQSEVRNRNGRNYPKGVMESAVNRYLTERVANKTAYGEFGHPQGPKINEERISHLIEKLEWQGNNVIGRAKIFNRGLGALVQGILEDGGRLGVSSRGLGSLKQQGGTMQVQNDFFIATAADVVTDPSAPDAFVNGVMENVEWVQRAGGTWAPQYMEETQQLIHNTPKSQLEEVKIAAFENFVKRLSEKKIS